MLYFFFFAAAALVPILDIFFEVLNKSYTWWLIPTIVIGGFVSFALIFLIVTALSITLVNRNKSPYFLDGYYRFMVNNTIKILVKLLRIKIHTTGIEIIPENERFLLVCNHISDVDPAIIIHEIPEANLGFIAKKEIITELPFVAKALHKLHCLFIDRDNNREAAKTVISAAKLIKDDVVSVGIFPEGYTSKTGELQDMRNGAFKIAQKANCAIVVCTVYGTRQAVKKLFIRKNHIYLDFLKVFTKEDAANLSTAQIGDEVHTLMEENLKKLSNEAKL